MVNDVSIVPAILANSEEEFKEKITQINSCSELAGGWIQVDLMDGKFVNNVSVDLKIVKKYPSSLKKEAHLMVENPIEYLNELTEADFQRAIFHFEVGMVEKVIEEIRSCKMAVGVALNPETQVSQIRPFVDRIDLVLVMGVHPGFGGQQFLAESLNKVAQLKSLKEEINFLIEVDGGIDETLVKRLADVGANNLVIGSRLFNGDVSKNLKKFWEALRS